MGLCGGGGAVLIWFYTGFFSVFQNSDIPLIFSLRCRAVLILLFYTGFFSVFQNPDIPWIFSLRRVAVLILLFYTGLLPFIPIKESLLEVIMPSIVLE